MPPGTGCWGPGIHWDAENSAAWTGPRAGAWPYAACPAAANSGLQIDPVSGTMFALPPGGLYPYSQFWTQATPGATPAPGTVLQPQFYVNCWVNGATPVINLPSPSCPAAGGRYEELSAWLDITLGTSSYVTATMNGQLVAPQTVWQSVPPRTFPGTLPTNAATTMDSIGTANLTNPNVVYYYDEPYGQAATGAGSIVGCIDLTWASGTPQAYWLGGPLSVGASTPWTVSLWMKPLVNPNQPANGISNSVGVALNGTYESPMALNVTTSTSGATTGTWELVSRKADTSSDPGYNLAYGTVTLTAGQWYHVAVVHNGSGSYTVYTNGALDFSLLGASTFATSAIGLNNYQYANTQFSSQSSGRATSMMFYPSALTLAQIQTLYNTPNTPPSGATHWWKLRDAVNQVRTVKTWMLPYTANINAFQGQAFTNLTITNQTGAGGNPCFINGWGVGVTGCGFYRNP